MRQAAYSVTTDAPTLDFPNGEDKPSGNDSSDKEISSIRDLEDFAQMEIDVDEVTLELITNYNYKVVLVSTGPQVNVFPAYQSGSVYLTDPDVANHQARGGTVVCDELCVYVPSYPPPPCSIAQDPNNLTITNLQNYFIFEGKSAGAGQLRVEIRNPVGMAVTNDAAKVQIQDIKSLYERARAINVTSGKPPSDLVSQCSGISTTPGMPNETEQVIIFVHGINNTVWDYENSSETMSKRLYWAGYHGRFAAFRWPCAYLWPTTWNPFQFNKGEFYAWKSATALKDYLTYLMSRPDLAGYAIDILAHSQGNIVASEAIVQGATFDNYILTQGAVPTHCYDTNAPSLQKLLDADVIRHTPFNAVNGGYHGYFADLQGNLVNFYNTNDFALAKGVTTILGIPKETNWEENQRTQKPEDFFGGPSYSYDPYTQTSTAYYTFGSHYTVTDSQEIKSMVARSRSAAVGAQGGLGGVIGSSVDLQTSFTFGKTRAEHSAQFTRPIQSALGYYQIVLIKTQPAP